jgi:hypothetical protein
VNGKNNLKKDSNPKPLGYKKDSNHCISFFPLKIIFKKYLNHSLLCKYNKEKSGFFLLGTVLYCIIIMLNLVSHLTCCAYLLFVVCKCIIIMHFHP